jgi:hypothetical protein
MRLRTRAYFGKRCWGSWTGKPPPPCSFLHSSQLEITVPRVGRAALTADMVSSLYAQAGEGVDSASGCKLWLWG